MLLVVVVSGGCATLGDTAPEPALHPTSTPTPTGASSPEPRRLGGPDTSVVTTETATSIAPSALPSHPPSELRTIDLSVRDPRIALERILRSLGRTRIDTAQWSIPDAEIEASALDTLAELATAAASLETTRDDGVRADIIVRSGDHRAVVTLVRWEGDWRLGAIVELLDAPPLVIVDAERGP